MYAKRKYLYHSYEISTVPLVKELFGDKKKVYRTEGHFRIKLRS